MMIVMMVMMSLEILRPKAGKEFQQSEGENQDQILKKGIGCNEHLVLYTTNESRNTTSKHGGH